MENRGKSEKTVVKAFVNDLRFFVDAIVDESNKMEDEAEIYVLAGMIHNMINLKNI